MPGYTPGRNIAMKLPERDYAKTVHFYSDVIGLDIIEEDQDGTVFAFGQMHLHLDRVPHQSQTDVWFEINTDDTAAARHDLTQKGVVICDEVEKLPPDFDGFWIAAPSGTIHLIDAKRHEEKGAPHG